MRFEPEQTDHVVLEELGRRIAQTRLELNLTQANLAWEAGIGVATLERLERGEDARLSTFLRVLRVLGKLEALELLLPEPPPSPVEQLRLHGKRRRRASGSRIRREPEDTSGPWAWGDERPDHR